MGEGHGTGADPKSTPLPERPWRGRAGLRDQAAAVSQGVNLVQATLINLFSVTPPLIYRLEEMAAWAGRPKWGE